MSVKLSCVAGLLLLVVEPEEAAAEEAELLALASTNCRDCCPANVTKLKTPETVNNRPNMKVAIQPIFVGCGDSLQLRHLHSIRPEFLLVDALALDCCSVGAGCRCRATMKMTTWTMTKTWMMMTTNGRNE